MNTLNKYETIFILNPDMNEEQVDSTIDKVKSIIESSNGVIDNVDLWGKKRLAYEIDKKNEGFFILINFSSSGEFPKELDRNFRIMDFVIRHIIVKKD